jgi:hypothetical protein
MSVRRHASPDSTAESAEDLAMDRIDRQIKRFRRQTIVASALGIAVGIGLGLGGSLTARSAHFETKPSNSRQDGSDPFTVLNDASRVAYRLAKDAALARSGPVILVEGDDLVLRLKAERRKVRFIPDQYHTIKAVSHVALAIDVTLAAHSSERALGDEVVKDLRDYRGLLPPVAEKIASAGLDDEDCVRAKLVLAECGAFLDAVLERQSCTDADRIAFTRRIWPLINGNMEAAARAALNALHRLVQLWRSELTRDEWDKLTVVVMGTQLPRKGNLAVQYFARLLGEPGECRRIIYGEALFDETRAIDLMATRIVDTQVGIDFFNDPLRMHRDLLADAAQNYLPILIDGR